MLDTLNKQTRPFFQVRHDCLIYYELPIIKYAPNSNNLKFAYSGKVTSGAQKRIRKAVDLLIQKSPKRVIYNPVTQKNQNFTLNFITLTVSSPINIKSSEGYVKLLKPFLRKMRNNALGKVSYVWKCELQKRGQIHYHITTNRFFHHTWIRQEWNKLQRRHKYLDHYAIINKSYNANSTDVHAVYKVKNIAAYLEKYLSKKDDEAQLDSKIWDCSKDLKIDRFSFTPTGSDMIRIENEIVRKNLEVVKLDNCTIIKTKDVKVLLDKSLLNLYKNHI